MENKIIIQENSFQRLEHKEPEKVKKYEHSMWKDIKSELLSNKVALISLIMLAIIMIAVLLAPLSPYDPYKIDVSQKLQGISAKHWFGTDDYGRDYFTRALYGGRVSLLVGLICWEMCSEPHWSRRFQSRREADGKFSRGKEFGCFLFYLCRRSTVGTWCDV